MPDPRKLSQYLWEQARAETGHQSGCYCAQCRYMAEGLDDESREEETDAEARQ